MKIELRRDRSKKSGDNSFSLDRKLASYLAASASIGAVMATRCESDRHIEPRCRRTWESMASGISISTAMAKSTFKSITTELI